MKRDNLKKYFTLAALLMVFTLGGFAQATEETENTKESDNSKEATAVRNDNDAATDTIFEETEEEVINAIQVTSEDVYISEAEKETDDDTDNSNDYTNNTFGNLPEGQVTKDQPITIFPNPMVTSTTIRFYNPDKSAVTIDIYDNLGRRVLHVPDLLGYEYKIGKDVIPEGIYYVKIKKKTSGDDDDDDELLVKNDKSQSDVLIYSAKLVVN